MHVETTTANVGIGEMKDLIPEEESKQELILVNDEEIKVIEKDDQKTEIPEIADVDGIKDLMQEGEIATTPSVAVASENSSDVPSLDDTKYSNETDPEESEIVESVDLNKVDPDEKPEEFEQEFSLKIAEVLANQLYSSPLTTISDCYVSEATVTTGTICEVSENEVTPDDPMQQVEVETQASDVNKKEDLSSIDREIVTLPKQESSTDEFKKLKSDQKTDECPMSIEEVSTHLSIDQVDGPSEDKETANGNSKSMEDKTVPVDEATEEEISVTESVSSIRKFLSPKESLISSVIRESSDKSEAVIKGIELTQEEDNQVPLTILVLNVVEEKENEDKADVQSLDSEQTSDLVVTSVEESIVLLPQVTTEMSSEVTVDKLLKFSEKEQLEEKFSFVDSEKPTDLSQVVPLLYQVTTEELVVSEDPAVETSKEAVEVEDLSEIPDVQVSIEPLFMEGSNEVPDVQVSSNHLVVKASSEPGVVGGSNEDPAVELSSEAIVVENLSEVPDVQISSNHLVVKASSEPGVVKGSSEDPAVELSSEALVVEDLIEVPHVQVLSEPLLIEDSSEVTDVQVSSDHLVVKEPIK